VKKIRYLVFDLDGTLIDSSEGVVACVNYSLRKMGQPEQPPERIKRFIGYQLSVMYPEFTDAPVDELHAYFREKALEVMVPSAVVLPGVEETLLRLHEEGYRMAIASTKIRLHIEGIVHKCGWREMFAARVGGDEVPLEKPAPDVFLEAIRRMGGSRTETLAIGDTINDVLAAQAASLEVCAVESPYEDRARVEAAKPDHLIANLAALPGLLDGVRT